ncbi:hypothetical protein BpJC7_04350 [Weizmannia acidilactici]|uniref:Uncharacterized protein n=1 Tax=Weizmannia acidilactici TaxID=2607726 RepID=A0A5J4J287_9BACI|nr:hypothetical protein [Weizmannia acidilactici]GER66231.1 hypothetical protein BpJC4_07020 [Weizmannia acidilactici]GER69132.1 hypothetical protein BpJC7_04350 [Weizmannia acidilactici]GER72171.1 hypothetical protein BpPP18_02380 [Weizmannia acidilactici]
MRAADKNAAANNAVNQFYGVNFRDAASAEIEALDLELASESGLSRSGVKLLKKKLGRS